MKRSGVRFSIFSVMLLLYFCSLSLLASDFSADVIETLGGKVETYRIHVQHNRYVMERTEKDKQFRVIIDREAKLTRIVVPADKTYYEIASDDLISLLNDPFQAALYSARKYQTKTIGKESLLGFDCEKILVHEGDMEMMTLWISEQSVVPLKLAHKSKTPRIVELAKLKIGSVDTVLFQIPGDFQKKPHPMQKRRVPDPTTLSAVSGTVSGKAPWGRRVKAGGELRVKVDETRRTRVRVTNLLKSEAKIEVLPFHQGKQRENIGVTPRKLDYKGSSFDREFNKDRDMFGSSFAVDEVVVKVSEGLVHVVVEQPGKELRDLYNRGGFTTWERISPELETRLTLTGDNPDADSTSGEILVRNDQAKTREKLPFELKNGETKSWSFGSDKGYDTLQITVPQGQGSMRVHIEQAAASIPPVLKSPSDQHQSLAPTRMVWVLDASGSMWGQLNGKTKMTIAKEVMTDLINELPADSQTGLTVYGHRRKGDCEDIEMLLPVGPHDAAAMNAKIQAINPKGKTPLSESVRRAAQALRHTEERASVVLLSDGLETCHADPCALAAELAMSGVDFTVHVIGFDIPQEEQARLRCMADRTGGLFLTASDTQSLRDALFKTLDEVREPPSPVVIDPGKASLTGPASVPVGAAFQVGWEGPDSHNDYVAIAKKQTRVPAFMDYAYTSTGNPLNLAAPGKAGEYELRYVHGHSRKIIGRRAIRVTPVQAEVKVPPSANVATEIEVAWSGPAYGSDYITIARVADPAGRYDNYAYTSKGTPARLWAPAEPGQYEARYILNRGTQILARAPLTVKGVTAQVQPPVSANAAAEFEVAWQGPDNEGDYITVTLHEDSTGRYDNYAYTNKGSPARLIAPSEPGDYEVRYIQARGTKMLARATITIQAVSAQVQPSASADVGAEFEVTWQGPDNQGDYITVALTGDSPGRYDNYVYTSRGSPARLFAPSEPGQYEVRYIQSKGTKLLAKAPITVNTVNAEVVPPVSTKTGEIFQVTWQGPDYPSDYLTVALPGDSPDRYDNYTYTSTGNPARLKAPAKPGEYEVRYILTRGTKILAKRTLRVTR